MARAPTVANPRILKLIELETAGRIKPEHQQELDTYRAQGLAPKSPTLTETQSKNTGFYARATEADKNFSSTESATDPRSAFEQGLVSILPEAVVNSFTSDDRQLSEQAKRNFIAATLRAESGAAISDSEYANQAKVFFPQPGDGPEVISQKARDRQVAIQALQASAGTGAERITGQLARGDMQFNDQAPAQVANPVNLNDQQKAAIAAVSQAGDKNAIRAVMRGFGVDVPDNELDAAVAFYANPERRNIAPNINDVDNSVKPVDPGDGALGAAARGAGDAITLGFLDEAGALADTVVEGGTYADNVNRRRGMAAYDEQNNAGSRLAGQVVGGFALPSFGANGAGQLARLGAAYGGAYGVGSADGDLGSRAAGGGVGALLGAGTGYALGRGAQYLAGRGGGPPPPTGAQELMAAAQRQGVEVLPADVGGPMTRRFTSAAAQGPLSAGPIIRAGQRVTDQMQGAVQTTAGRIGNAVDPVEAGEAAIVGARSAINRMTTRGGDLYDEAGRMAGDARVDPVNARAMLDEQIARMEAVPGGGAGLLEARALRAALGGASATARPGPINHLPSSESLATPPTPSPEQMRRFSRIEEVPLESARATQSQMDWGDARKTPGDLINGYGDIPVAVRKENGEYLIFDGHHRAVQSMRDGKQTARMHVIDAKDFSPETAGRPNISSGLDDDALLAELRVSPTPGSGSKKFSVEGIRDMRTELFVAPELRGTPATRRMRQVVDAAAKDVEDSLRAAGRGHAADQFAKADRYWKARIETIDNTIQPIIGSAENPKSGEQVYQALMTAGRSNAAKLRTFVNALPADEQATVRATVISRLGMANAGTQGTEGSTFSASQFLTHWNQLTPRAKDVLFRGESRDALNDLAKVAEGSKAAAQYANRSNTGGAVFGNVGGWLGLGSVAPTTAALGAAGQMISGKLLASPRFARWLARPASTPRDLATQVRRLGAIASREPAIANDILPIQKALQAALPTRAAAEDQKQNGR